MNSSKIWTPDFSRLDLVALYTTMYLKRIVQSKLPWQEHLNILYEEVKSNLLQLEKEDAEYLYPTLRDFARIYSDQCSIKEYDIEVGKPTFYTLLLVLALRLGMKKLWVPDLLFFREDILIEGFLSHKPTLKLTFLCQDEPLFEYLTPLCPNLIHVSLPFTDSALFAKVVKIKSLRILEFSSGVADKVLCYALWNIDKKSDKVLQIAIKDRKEGYSLVLPHLEVLRSNVNMVSSGASSLKVTLGAAALVLQPKMKIVENRSQWTTLEAIQALLEMENKFKIKHQRRLTVEKLLFRGPHSANNKLEKEQLIKDLPHIFEMCPHLNDITITENFFKIPAEIMHILKKKLTILERLSLDITPLSIEQVVKLFTMLGRTIKHLTLKINMTLIVRMITYYHPDVDDMEATEGLNLLLLPGLESLTLIMSEDKLLKMEELEDMCSPTTMITFLSLFSNIRSLHYYSMFWVPPLFAVFGCIGGAMAVVEHLSHLSIDGYHSYLSNNPYDFMLKKKGQPTIKDLIPELIDDSTFCILTNLKSFSLDELFLSPRVDRFLEMLRASNVHVKILYKSRERKETNISSYLDSNEYHELYTTSRIKDFTWEK